MTRAHFVEELEAIHQSMLSMGELTLRSIGSALKCLTNTGGATFEEVTALESEIDEANTIIHDRALKILILQSPVAGDARLITSILESIIDLEQIADYAYEISDLALQTDRRPASQVLSQVVAIGEQVREMLASALDGWSHLDRAAGLSLRSSETSIRTGARALADRLYQLTSSPADAQLYVNLILICKHFERMARLSAFVAEQAALAAPVER